MSKLDRASDIDLAERAEQLSREAEQLRKDEKAVPHDLANGTAELDRAVSESVQRLRRLAER